MNGIILCFKMKLITLYDEIIDTRVGGSMEYERIDLMPIELGVWRIDDGLNRLDVKSLDEEKRLEAFLDEDITIASPCWMIIGRQVYTDYGKYIDLLAIDRDGNLIVLELKKNRPPRDVVAQLLDYGSWVKDLKDDEIAAIFDNYIKKYHPERNGISLDEAFVQFFNLKEMPDELNETHQLVVVASQLDDSTERIVSYLSQEHNVPINAIFFRVFKDDEREYLSSMWLIDPSLPSPTVVGEEKEPWNGEYYVSFGHDDKERMWEDARKYNFISAGGGSWYTKTLKLLEIDKRIWVNVPGKGYVGVGEVVGPPVKVDQFEIESNGQTRLLTPDDLVGPGIFTDKDDDEKSEYLVEVKWIKIMDLDKAIKETGFFGNQNTVCKPVTKKWQHTVERLKKRFEIST